MSSLDVERSIILGIGSGRCGTRSLVEVLNRQPGAQVSHEEPPRLPWRREPGDRVICERFARWRRMRDGLLLGDVASFYLPYVEDAIAAEPNVRIVCLKRPREEVIRSFCDWLDRVHGLPTNHWAETPAAGWHHHPIWTRIFPQYQTQDREEGIGRYWDEYYARVDALVGRYPEHIRVFAYDGALNTEAGLREVLTFAGIPPERQVLAVGITANQAANQPGPAAGRRASGHPMDPRRCVILVPFFQPMLHKCDDGYWYLAEDYGFCQRARECGFKIMADTTIRLWHVGNYAFGWEDAGMERQRTGTFTLHFPEHLKDGRPQ